jgi:hypothetical protein
LTSTMMDAKLFAATVNKLEEQEKQLDTHLMQLCLVDVASGRNAKYVMTKDQPHNSSATNVTIKYILNSQVSFRLISKVIRMSSHNWLKPFQLQTAMCYAEIKYHSNDYTFMQIMADVLNVTKLQLKAWKDQKHHNQISGGEETKSASYGLQKYTYNPVAKPAVALVTDLIAVSEKMARDKMSEMIGEKIIGKVFNDNLKDFKEDEDMEPIQNICSIIIRVLVILKELDVKQRAQIESQVLYRSNILQILFKYVKAHYTVAKFPLDDVGETNPKILR